MLILKMRAVGACCGGSSRVVLLVSGSAFNRLTEQVGELGIALVPHVQDGEVKTTAANNFRTDRSSCFFSHWVLSACGCLPCRR